jgi:hypothetical protein
MAHDLRIGSFGGLPGEPVEAICVLRTNVLEDDRIAGEERVARGL